MLAHPRYASSRSWRHVAGSVGLLCAIVGGPIACGPTAEQKEARRVVAIIDQMRAAPPEKRKPHLETLEQIDVRGTAAQTARQRCAKTYRALLDAGELESKARRRLAFPSPPASALSDLATAEDKIEEATAEMPRCNEALAALRRIARR